MSISENLFLNVIHFYKKNMRKILKIKYQKGLLVVCIQIPISVASLCLTYFSQSPVMLKHFLQNMPVLFFPGGILKGIPQVGHWLSISQFPQPARPYKLFHRLKHSLQALGINTTTNNLVHVCTHLPKYHESKAD